MVLVEVKLMKVWVALWLGLQFLSPTLVFAKSTAVSGPLVVRTRLQQRLLLQLRCDSLYLPITLVLKPDSILP